MQIGHLRTVHMLSIKRSIPIGENRLYSPMAITKSIIYDKWNSRSTFSNRFVEIFRKSKDLINQCRPIYVSFLFLQLTSITKCYAKNIVLIFLWYWGALLAIIYIAFDYHKSCFNMKNVHIMWIFLKLCISSIKYVKTCYLNASI